MKKKIISLLLLGMYFFGGFGTIVSAETIVDEKTGNTMEIITNKDGEIINVVVNNANGDIKAISNDGKTIVETNGSDTLTITDADGNTKTTTSKMDRNDMTSTSFTLDPSNLSPSEKKYNKGTKTNFRDLLQNIGKYLLIATTTLAVLSIVVGGLMISTTGPSDRAAKGKTIIMLNIMAIVIALFSYSIIQFVSWIINV